jgi:predicted N-acetyltransferase YhbS
MLRFIGTVLFFLTSSHVGASTDFRMCQQYVGLVKSLDQSSARISGLDLRIERVSPQNELEVVDLIRTSYRKWTEQGIYEFLTYKSNRELGEDALEFGFLVRDSSGELVATFQLVPASHPKGNKGAYIERARTAVAEKFQRRGIMTELRKLIESKAREMGYDGILIRVAESTGWLYEWDLRSGFQKISSFENPTSSGKPEVIWWMEKKL